MGRGGPLRCLLPRASFQFAVEILSIQLAKFPPISFLALIVASRVVIKFLFGAEKECIDLIVLHTSHLSTTVACQWRGKGGLGMGVGKGCRHDAIENDNQVSVAAGQTIFPTFIEIGMPLNSNRDISKSFNCAQFTAGKNKLHAVGDNASTAALRDREANVLSYSIRCRLSVIRRASSFLNILSGSVLFSRDFV